MKRLLLLTCINLFILKISNSQNCAPNNIYTNPDPAVRNNPQRPSMTNVFDWTQADFPLNIRHIYNGNTTIRSPFFDTDNGIINTFYDPIPGPKDFLPVEDGWELIKKDFGFEPTGVVNNPYFILYNKYRGLLRVFIARGDQAFFNGASVQIKFHDESPAQTSLLDHSSELRAINATFLRNPKLFSASNILNGYAEWFYADFPMNYDPCTCIFQSKIQILVHLSSTSTISLSGTSNGEIVTQGRPSSSQDEKGSFSIGDLGTLAKKTHNTYKSLASFKSDIIGKGGNSTAVTDLTNKLKDSKFLKSGLSFLPYAGAALSIVDFFTGGGRKASGPQEVSVMPMSITMTSKYNGSLTTEYPYSNITFRTPGSNPGNAPDSEYPYYNEVLGILSLLKTPQINFAQTTQPFGTTPYGEIRYRDSFFYRLAQPIEYVLNPAARVEVQEIKAALVIGSDQGGSWNSPLGFKHFEGNDATTQELKFRTDYFDLNCLPQKIFTVYTVDPISPPQAGPTNNLKLKIMANLRRLDATDDTQNILFVATYQVSLNTVSNIGTVQSCTGIVQQPESATYIQNFCTSSTYTNSTRFLRIKGYDDLVKDLEESERINQTTETTNNITFFPNPVSKLGHIKYTVNKQGYVKITIINSLGLQNIILYSSSHEIGTYQFDLDVSHYKNGPYILIYEMNGERRTNKILIQN